MSNRILLVLPAALMLFAPSNLIASGVQRLGQDPPALMGVHFVDVSRDRGASRSKNQPGMGSGCAAADFDNDGWVDFYLVQREGSAGLLMHNLGNGSFEEVSGERGLLGKEGGRTALWLDADNDGLLDLMVANDVQTAPTSFRFYHQNPDHTFSEVTEAVGLMKAPIVEIPQHHWGGICAGDINNDGYLDIFTGQWSGPAHLFLNRGDGTFRDISESAGFPDYSSWRHQPIMADFDGDGWLDIYTAVDFDPNEMWINQHNNTFVNVAPSAGVDNLMNDMGVTLGDYDNDGDLDIYLTNIHQEGKHNVLYRNDSVGGRLRFTEISQPMGVDDGAWGWGTTWMDADNDGLLDLAATNGFTTIAWTRDVSRFWANRGAGPFVDVSDEIGFNDTDWGSALVAADLDRDGDLDLIQLCMSSPLTVGRVRILDNQPVAGFNPNHYLDIQPRTYDLNRFGIGAVVRVQAGGKSLMRLITAGTSYLGQEPAEAFFGLGAATVAERVEVNWPDGTKTVRNDVAADQVLKIMHPRPAKHVRIDIKPGNPENVVNLDSHGVLPVGIFSDATFDASILDPHTIRLAGAPVRALGNGRLMAWVKDLDHDGRPDLEVHVETDQIRMKPTQIVAELRAEMPVDQPIVGSDVLRIVGREERRAETMGQAATPEFALVGALHNPSARDLAISFSLPSGNPGTLALYDIAGRRLRSVEVGSLGAGPHVVDLGGAVRVAPGLYFVRLTQGERSAVTRVAVAD